MTEEILQIGQQSLWLIAYDVQSENSKSLKDAQSDWLRSKRVEIWYALRYKYKCVPVQNSLWLIRDEKTRAELDVEKNTWLEDYAVNHFGARIEIFPIQTNDVGYKTFKSWELDFIMEWLGKIQKAMTKAVNSGGIGKKNVQAHTKKLQLLKQIFNEDFDSNYPNWGLAKDLLLSVEDFLHKAQYRA